MTSASWPQLLSTCTLCFVSLFFTTAGCPCQFRLSRLLSLSTVFSMGSFNILLQCTPFLLTIIVFFLWTHRSFKTLPENLPSQVVKFLFNSTMCCSLIILELVLCETGNWLSPESRLVAWKLSTFWLSIMLVAVLPVAELYLFFNSNNRI